MQAPAEPSDRFSHAARAASGQVIDAYSTSFGLAVRSLGRRHRAHVRSVYALVRIADEIVDGAAAGFGLDIEQQRETLDRYERAALAAISSGYSTDPVLHSFARTALASGIDHTLLQPFFASMRSDLASSPVGRAAQEAYVYGSAEVVGLMCLRVFIREEELGQDQEEQLANGARKLGAAFQNINFLRDLRDDSQRLGRSYLSDSPRLTEREHEQWLRTIRGQLAEARSAIPLLPRDCRGAVLAAHMIFSALLRRLGSVPTAELYSRRIRVPNRQKAGLIAGALIGARLQRGGAAPAGRQVHQ